MTAVLAALAVLLTATVITLVIYGLVGRFPADGRSDDTR